MVRSARSVVLLGGAVTGIALLSACGKKAPEVPATAPPTAATTAAAPATMPSSTPPAAGSVAATQPATAKTAATPGNAGAAAPASSASTASTAPAPASISVAKVSLGRTLDSAREVARTSDHFSDDDKTIYATVATTGKGSDAKLSAKWSYLEGKGQVISDISQPITTNGPAFTTFKVENPDLWPQGKYRVEIALDGHVVSKQDFRIGKR